MEVIVSALKIECLCTSNGRCAQGNPGLWTKIEDRGGV